MKKEQWQKIQKQKQKAVRDLERKNGMKEENKNKDLANNKRLENKEPLSVTIEKARNDIHTAVITTERKYGLHSSLTLLILEAVLANVRAGNAMVATMEFEAYKEELLKNE